MSTAGIPVAKIASRELNILRNVKRHNFYDGRLIVEKRDRFLLHPDRLSLPNSAVVHVTHLIVMKVHMNIKRLKCTPKEFCSLEDLMTLMRDNI
jgi:hypothetical protein